MVCLYASCNKLLIKKKTHVTVTTVTLNDGSVTSVTVTVTLSYNTEKGVEGSETNDVI